MSETRGWGVAPTPEIVAELWVSVPLADHFELEARVEWQRVHFLIRRQKGGPQRVTWGGWDGQELEVSDDYGQALVGVGQLHKAQQAARRELCRLLRAEHWPYRKIAQLLGLHLRQVERWSP